MILRRKCNGAKIYTEALDPERDGRGAFYTGRSMTGRTCGLYRRENAGMSSENYVRIIMVENLRFLEEGSSAQGKSGAKARPGGVVDAHTVEIP